MKPDTISLRRRRLMMAGLAAPATLFAAQYGGTPGAAPVAELAAGDAEKMVVSGRMLGANGKPLSGARVKLLRADPKGDASVTTDADGRFMFTTAAVERIDYRVSHHGHATPVKQLHFARGRGVPGAQIVRLQRDDAGVWRGTFGLTLA